MVESVFFSSQAPEQTASKEAEGKQHHKYAGKYQNTYYYGQEYIN
jgi:hypothetical protein